MQLTEDNITAAAVRTMREELGLTQTAFWKPLGVSQSVGCRYESDVPIPKPVRILIVTHYVAGIDITEDVKELAKLGSIQSAFQEASGAAASARSDLERAVSKINEARTSLAGL